MGISLGLLGKGFISLSTLAVTSTGGVLVIKYKDEIFGSSESNLPKTIKPEGSENPPATEQTNSNSEKDQQQKSSDPETKENDSQQGGTDDSRGKSGDTQGSDKTTQPGAEGGAGSRDQQTGGSSS